MSETAFDVYAPGRVNLLGEHTDYNGGPVLPIAIELEVRLACIPPRVQPGGLLDIQAHHHSGHVHISSIEGITSREDSAGHALPRWALYPAGVAWVIHEAGFRFVGGGFGVGGNLPMEAGLSSSAAVEAAFALAFQSLGGWEADRMTLARLCQRAENEYVGVSCGLMDPFAILHGVEGHALLFDTRTLAWEPVPLPKDVVVVIADSGVRRELASSAYNERRAQCREAVERLRKQLPKIEFLADLSPAELETHAGHLDPLLLRRVRHVVEECERVRRAAGLLRAGDAAGFGRLMFEGHASLRDLYDVSSPELDALVEAAGGLPGCLGARLTGAGFGGCTVNLVESAHAPAFVGRLREEYLRRTARDCRPFVTTASDGARVIVP